MLGSLAICTVLYILMSSVMTGLVPYKQLNDAAPVAVALESHPQLAWLSSWVIWGALFGLTRGTGPNELARAALESVCFQTLDLVDAMRADCGALADTVLRVDGGMVASDWTMQRLADILGAPVDRPTILETTALGAAYLAGLQSGLYPEPSVFAARWALDRRFTAAMDEATRARKIAAWKHAVRRTLSGREVAGTPS